MRLSDNLFTKYYIILILIRDISPKLSLSSLLLSGGFALLAVSGVAGNVTGAGALGALGAGGIAPILGGLGLVGAAGAAGMGLMAMAECGGPALCVAASGQCCVFRMSLRGPTVCPASC